MMIQKAILHILDFNTNMCILSQKDLDFSSDVVYEYVDKRIERLLKDAGQQTGIFYATSSFQHVLQQLQMEEITFNDAAAVIAKKRMIYCLIVMKWSRRIFSSSILLTMMACGHWLC